MSKNPNDNFVIMRAKRLPNGEYRLLCKLPDNVVTPWATYVSPTIDGRERYSGQYYYSSEESYAYEDYETRF